MDNQMAFQLGEITGITLLLTIFLPLVHWAARKIRRKPKKRLRDWLTSWIAGPEVFFAGIVYEMAGEGEALVILFGVALEYVGLAMLIIRASTSAVSRFRRQNSCRAQRARAGGIFETCSEISRRAGNDLGACRMPAPANLWETDGGVYFGHRILPDQASHDRSLLDEEWQVVGDKLHRYTGDRHLVTVGPNGSGKTRRLLIPNLVFLKNWSILVVDPKGTLAALTGPYRESQHPNSVMVIDPFGVLEREYPALVKRYPFLKSAGFNPVAALDPE